MRYWVKVSLIVLGVLSLALLSAGWLYMEHQQGGRFFDEPKWWGACIIQDEGEPVDVKTIITYRDCMAIKENGSHDSVVWNKWFDED